MVQIRAELPADQERVFALQAAAFQRPDEAKLVDLLRATARPFISLVAETNGKVVGHVFFSPVSIDSSASPPPVAGLAPVGVDPVHQGRGIGSALIKAGLQRCPQKGWSAVFLVGNPTYYSRFGFVLAAPLGFTYGNDRFDPFLQLLELFPGALSGSRGRVRFHSAFAESGTG